MKKVRGITLIEILITILIMSILASIAGPSFFDSFKKRRLVSAAEELYSHLQLARSEALSGKMVDEAHVDYPKYDSIFVSFSGSGISWSYGLSQGEDCTPTVTSNVGADACVLTVEVGNDSAAEDNVLMRVDSSDFDDVSFTPDTTPIEFNPTRGTVNKSYEFVLTSATNDSIKIKLSKLGNVSICSSDLSEYSSC